MQTQKPRVNFGAISARYEGATTVVCPIPRPMMKRPAYTMPMLPFDAAARKMATPRIHTTQSCLVAQSRPEEKNVSHARIQPISLSTTDLGSELKQS